METSTSQSNLSTKNFPIVPVIISVILTGAVVGGGVFWLTDQKQGQRQGDTGSPLSSTVAETPAPSNTTTPALDRVFALGSKQAGTKIYYSDTLGVGFTYLSLGPDSPVKITESGNTIDVAGQTIEVFTKDPNVSLEQAIKDRFLQGYNSADCFVKTNGSSGQPLAQYISAEISFPVSEDADEPWWKNSVKCPQPYSQTNSVRYFLLNKDVPGKFLFLRLGQESIAYDGAPATSEGKRVDWSRSIQILK